MRYPALLFLLAAITTPAAGQSDLEDWIRERFRGRDRVAPRKILNEARRRGRVRTPAQAHALKAQLRGLIRSQGPWSRWYVLKPRAALGPSGPSPLAASDVEYNDTPAYANDLGTLSPTVTSVQGSLAAGESDCFGFDLSSDGTLKLAVTSSGTVPDFVIMSRRGEALEWGESNIGTFDLPKGRYYVSLHHTRTATSYTLSASHTPKALNILTPSLSKSWPLGTDPTTFRLLVPADGRVTLTLSSTGSADTYLFLYNSQMRYMFDVDDAGQSGSDAGLNAHLVAGIYYVTVTPDQATTTTFNYKFRAASVPFLSCTAKINGNLPGGEEDFDLYRIVIGQPTAETLAITGNGASPIQDSYLMIFDREMGFFFESDEETPQSSFSKITVTLPPGIYLASSNGYYDRGGYTISRGCGTGATTAARAGLNLGNVSAPSTAQTMVFQLRTPVPIEFDVNEVGLPDAMIGIVDAKTGLSRGQNDDAWHYGSCNIGSPQEPGELYVLVKDWDGGTGTFDLNILTPLHRSQGDRLRGLDHGGNVVLFLASTKTIPPFNPVPGLTNGFLLVDLLGSISFPVIVPPGGKLDWGFSLKPKQGIYLQQVSFALTPLAGTFSNLID